MVYVLFGLIGGLWGLVWNGLAVFGVYSLIKVITSQKNAPIDNNVVAPPPVSVPVQAPVQAEVVTQSINVQAESSESSWYSENSINLMLYVGAFLIVAAASILVGFQWQTYSGTFKAFILTFTSVAFLISGIFMAKSAKISHAGNVFTGIGALLIPFCGFGWYNLVLKDFGINSGVVWIFTSIVSLLIYLYLSFSSKQKVYPYAASLTVISFFLAIVKVYGLNNEFFVLNSIISSILLLAAAKYVPAIFSKAFNFSSQVTVPISLVLGLALAIGNGHFFSLETALGIFLGCSYYLLAYKLENKLLNLFLAQALFPISVWVYLRFSTLNSYGAICLVLDAIVVAYFGIGYILNKKKEYFFSSLILSGLVFLAAFITGLDPQLVIFLNLVCIFLAAALTYLMNVPEVILLVTGLLSVLIWEFWNKLGIVVDGSINQAVTSLVLGILAYFVSNLVRIKRAYGNMFLASAVWFGVLAITMAMTKNWLIAVILTTLSVEVVHYAFVNSKPSLVYLASGFMTLAAIQTANYLEISAVYMPVVISFVGLLLYLIGVMNSKLAKEFRFGGMAVLFIGGMFITNRYGLVASLIVSVLAIIEATVYGRELMAYLASAGVLFTLLKFYNIQHITETQVYTAHIGIYFLGLGFVRRFKADFKMAQAFDWVGLVELLLFTAFQAFDPKTFIYALFLGLYGLVLFFLGVNFNLKVYKYAAMVAICLSVLSQTYAYIFRMPWWLIVAVLGMSFLAFATYLLSKRKISK